MSLDIRSNSKVLVFLLATLPFSLQNPTQAQNNNQTQITISQTNNTIIFRAQVDRYLELRRSILDPSLNLSNMRHEEDAKLALESLSMFEKEMSQTLSGLNLSLDDKIDHILIRNKISDYRDRIQQSLQDEKIILDILPAANLRLRLPDLTGLVEDSDLETGLRELKIAQTQIPAPWAPMPENQRLSIIRAISRRSEILSREVNTWYGRVKNRFPQKAESAEKPVSAVQKGLKAFSEQLTKEVIPDLQKSEAAWGSPVGYDRFVSLLQTRHMIYDTPEQLLQLGKTQLADIHEQIKQIARKINRRKSAEEVWEQLKTEHPSREELPKFAYDEMQKSLKLLLETDAVTIPENARNNVMLITEGRTFDTYPFGGYGGFKLKGKEFIGRFMTSPPKADMDADAAEARLRGNNYYWARVVAVHEIYPGHHLQNVTKRLKARPMRRDYSTTTLSEGWGLYSEQMMYRLGFFPDDKTTMAMLMMRAWRASRIVIDVSLHLGKMSFDECVQFLVDNVDMDKENATAEVRRYLGNPTRPLSYLYGYNQIERLRLDFMKMRGDQFTDKEFHDTFLTYGSIPIPLIRSGMLGDPLPEINLTN